MSENTNNGVLLIKTESLSGNPDYWVQLCAKYRTCRCFIFGLDLQRKFHFVMAWYDARLMMLTFKPS